MLGLAPSRLFFDSVVRKVNPVSRLPSAGFTVSLARCRLWCSGGTYSSALWTNGLLRYYLICCLVCSIGKSLGQVTAHWLLTKTLSEVDFQVFMKNSGAPMWEALSWVPF